MVNLAFNLTLTLFLYFEMTFFVLVAIKKLDQIKRDFHKATKSTTQIKKDSRSQNNLGLVNKLSYEDL